MLNVSQLPDELIRMIFLYLQAPEAKMIRDEIKIYNVDHNYWITQRSGYYLVRSILSFSQYYFNKLADPYEYDSTYYDQFAINRELAICQANIENCRH